MSSPGKAWKLNRSKRAACRGTKAPVAGLSAFGGTATRSLVTLRNPRLGERHRSGHCTSATQPAAAETCTALIWQRGAVAERSLIRLRKQQLLRQVFECLQDRLLCTFLKAD